MKKIESLVAEMTEEFERRVENIQKFVADFMSELDEDLRDFTKKQTEKRVEFARAFNNELFSLRTYMRDEEEVAPVVALTKMAKLPFSVPRKDDPLTSRTAVDMNSLARELSIEPEKFASKA